MHIMMGDPVLAGNHGVSSENPAEILANILVDHTLVVMDIYRERINDVPKKIKRLTDFC